MTERDPLQGARQWSAALAATLDEVAGELDAAARRLAEGWSDARGRERTDRLHLLGRGLVRDAEDARDLGRALDRLAVDLGVDPGAADPGVGPQLGGTAARRAGDHRGVTIPQLGDTAGG